MSFLRFSGVRGRRVRTSSLLGIRGPGGRCPLIQLPQHLRGHNGQGARDLRRQLRTQSHGGRLDAQQDHLTGRHAEQAQVVEQSGYAKLVCVAGIDLLWIRTAKIHPDGIAGRQVRIHGVDDQQVCAPADLGQQIGSDGTAVDEAGHRLDARVFPQTPDCMDTDSVIGQQQVSDADDGNGRGGSGSR